MADPIYGVRADLTKYSLPASALAPIPIGDQDAALDAASRKADGYLAAQFTLPLLAWGTDLTEQICHWAAQGLMGVRGFKPGAGGDQLIMERAAQATRWFEQVAAGKVHPRVTDSAAGAAEGIASAGPIVSSSSQRGWTDFSGGSGPFGGD